MSFWKTYMGATKIHLNGSMAASCIMGGLGVMFLFGSFFAPKEQATHLLLIAIAFLLLDISITCSSILGLLFDKLLSEKRNPS